MNQACSASAEFRILLILDEIPINFVSSLVLSFRHLKSPNTYPFKEFYTKIFFCFAVHCKKEDMLCRATVFTGVIQRSQERELHCILWSYECEHEETLHVG